MYQDGPEIQLPEIHSGAYRVSHIRYIFRFANEEKMNNFKSKANVINACALGIVEI